jgi:hypothetical protein
MRYPATTGLAPASPSDISRAAHFSQFQITDHFGLRAWVSPSELVAAGGAYI